MSLFQELKLSNERGNSLLSLKVADFIKDVCSKCERDSEKTADIFMEMLTQLLFRFAELMPSHKVQINRIIRVLVDYGVQYRSSYHCDTTVVNQKPAYSMLHELDKKINYIQDIKMKIYNELVTNESVIDSVKREIAVDSFQDIVTEEAFHPTSVKKLAQLVQSTKTVKSSDIGQSSSLLTETPSSSYIPDVLQGRTANADIDISTENNVNLEVRSLEHSVTMENLSSPILCIKVYEDVCAAGCENGELQLFNLDSGLMIDRIQAHSLPITSLVIWNNIIITCSYDKTMRSFNLTKNSTKCINIDHPIETATDDLNGVLYAGTSSGKIFRFNMLSLTQIGIMFHVSATKILFMKVFYQSWRHLIAVSAENKPLVIRSADTGTLLKTLQVDNIISFDVCLQDNSWFGISEDAIYYMPFIHSDEIKSIPSSNLSKLCIYGNQIVVCGNEGKLYIYDKELIEQKKWTGGLNDDVTGIVIWNHFVHKAKRNQMLVSCRDAVFVST